MLRRVITVCDGAAITGGTEKVAVTTATELAARGYTGLYFAGEEAIDPGLQESMDVVTLGLKDAYHTESKRELLQRFFWNKPAGERFAREVRSRGFSPEDTIVHVHGFRRVLSGSVVAKAKEMGFKVVFTLHDYGIACPNTSFFEFPNQQICTRRPLSLSCNTCQCTHSGWKMKAMQMGRGYTLKFRRIADAFDRFIFVSEFSRVHLEPHLPKATPKRVIYNPVSGRQEPIARPGQAEHFTYIGRLSPEKGGVAFARAALAAGAACRFVGTGPEAEAIRTANPKAELTGWLSPAGVESMIRSSRAVVMPSLWYETAGLSVIEAVSRGVPVIVSDRCASVEYVTAGETGAIYAGGASAESIAALAAVLKGYDAATADRHGSAGYERYWQDPLTVDRHMNQLIPWLESALVD